MLIKSVGVNRIRYILKIFLSEFIQEVSRELILLFFGCMLGIAVIENYARITIVASSSLTSLILVPVLFFAIIFSLIVSILRTLFRINTRDKP